MTRQLSYSAMGGLEYVDTDKVTPSYVLPTFPHPAKDFLGTREQLMMIQQQTQIPSRLEVTD